MNCVLCMNMCANNKYSKQKQKSKKEEEKIKETNEFFTN